ncbi:heterokaryon incompatibility protein-domain-containing protein [Pyrenochaeta sp. MPI-SDFR-AT-0127]|nr:heterokaryon incompatibility protein-domain-containing protein [Pyrenochaeta sp. MPI-SDFR-AT-0127]
MAGDNRSFPYQQLRPEHEEVRLLVLQPAAALEDPIACEIQVVSLRFNPQYDAISYVWGAPGCRGTITLSARPFTIFENLEAALKRLRKKAASRVLWIDAVCINQNDNDEKVFQIPLMRRIYEQAEQVCIWLGEASEGSSLGMRELFDRPWWTRVWIMQEAIVAKKLLLMCGKDTACWTDVDRWVKRSVLINGPKKQYEVFGLALNPDFQLMNGGHAMLSELRQKWHGNAWDLSIYELLYKFRRLNCTNPKDRIYGFLGLTRRRKALMHPLHTELSHLPSWVPNWAIPTQWDPEPLLDWSNSSPRYWASGSFHQNLILTGDRDKLCLEGVNFDTIMELANPWHPDSDIPPASRKGLEVLKSWEQLARWPKVKGCPYTSAQGNAYGRQYATWRTHIADYAGQNAAPAEVSAFIECWYDRIGWATDIPNPDAMDGKGLYERYKVGRDVSLMDVDMILHLDELRGVDVNWMKDRSADTKQYGEYAKRIHNTCAHRALFVTQKGYIGLAPWNAKLGDLVFLLRGGKTPFILRRQIMVDGYSLVGESYVYGIMSGEGWKMGLPLQRIELI